MSVEEIPEVRYAKEQHKDQKHACFISTWKQAGVEFYLNDTSIGSYMDWVISYLCRDEENMHSIRRNDCRRLYAC